MDDTDGLCANYQKCAMKNVKYDDFTVNLFSSYTKNHHKLFHCTIKLHILGQLRFVHTPYIAN